MGRRARLVVLAVLVAVVLAVGGGFAVLALTGGDAPPPPRLSETPEASSRCATVACSSSASCWRRADRMWQHDRCTW